MKVTFKDVGQGDSIWLEWEGSGETQYAIIDCKTHHGKNPILEQLKQSQPRKIKYIILSHPHRDHFSGMLELLSYCHDEGIQIEHFLHTVRVDPRWTDHLRGATGSWSSYKQLALLLFEVHRLYTNKPNTAEGPKPPNQVSEKERRKPTILNASHLELCSLRLNADWIMDILAPSEMEMSNFVRRVQAFLGLNAEKCQQAGNLLSTVIAISSLKADANALLTADAEKETLLRIAERNGHLFSQKLLLAQIPHHGSIENHLPEFWSRFAKESHCPAVASAGKHGKYNHPDREVIQDFEALGYGTHCTNDVNGFLENRLSKKAQLRSDLLDLFSEQGHEVESQGGSDRVFLIGHSQADAVLT